MTALAMTEALSDRYSGDSPQEHTVAIAEAVQLWGQDTITEAFGVLIGVAMSHLNATEPDHDDPGGEFADQPAALRLVIPAILTRFRRVRMPQIPADALPTAAGILTAAVYGHSPYEWRVGLGPISQCEALMWCYVAWLVIDFVDATVIGEPGGFAAMLAEALRADEKGQP